MDTNNKTNIEISLIITGNLNYDNNTLFMENISEYLKHFYEIIIAIWEDNVVTRN